MLRRSSGTPTTATTAAQPPATMAATQAPCCHDMSDMFLAPLVMMKNTGGGWGWGWVSVVLDRLVWFAVEVARMWQRTAQLRLHADTNNAANSRLAVAVLKEER
jgi:uncharacterized membrane protein